MAEPNSDAEFIAELKADGYEIEVQRDGRIIARKADLSQMERELREHRFDGIVTLHADDTCNGLYGYAHGRVLNESLLRPALDAASRILPRDTRASIDGFVATESILRDCFGGVLAAPPDQAPHPFDLIFETPALAPLDRQVDATVVALHTILGEYRKFIAYAQDL